MLNFPGSKDADRLFTDVFGDTQNCNKQGIEAFWKEWLTSPSMNFDARDISNYKVYISAICVELKDEEKEKVMDGMVFSLIQFEKTFQEKIDQATEQEKINIENFKDKLSDTHYEKFSDARIFQDASLKPNPRNALCAILNNNGYASLHYCLSHFDQADKETFANKLGEITELSKNIFIYDENIFKCFNLGGRIESNQELHTMMDAMFSATDEISLKKTITSTLCAMGFMHNEEYSNGGHQEIQELLVEKYERQCQKMGFSTQISTALFDGSERKLVLYNIMNQKLDKLMNFISDDDLMVGYGHSYSEMTQEENSGTHTLEALASGLNDDVFERYWPDAMRICDRLQKCGLIDDEGYFDPQYKSTCFAQILGVNIELNEDQIIKAHMDLMNRGYKVTRNGRNGDELFPNTDEVKERLYAAIQARRASSHVDDVLAEIGVANTRSPVTP